MRVRMITIGIALLLSMTTIAAQNAADLYQQGLAREAEGNMQEAIRIFERIVREFPANRAVAGKALMQLAEWSEILGRNQAGNYYTRVIREYGDQNDLVSEARKRLADRDKPASPEFVLALVDRNGAAEKLKARPANYRGPALSPDGRQVAVEIIAPDARTDIWIYNLAGTTARQLTREGNNVHPVWTPDGKRITYASDRGGKSEIYWQPADGTGMVERLITSEEAGERQFPESWSPDGRNLSLTKLGTGDQTVWVMSLDNREKPYLVAQGTAGGAVFSPDGRWLAYRQNRTTGSEQIYIQPFPTTGEIYSVTQTGGSHPVWSPRGGELFYRTGLASVRSGSARVMVLELTTEGGAPRTTNERDLPVLGFQATAGYRSYDVTRDGRFLVILPVDTPGK